MGKRFYLLTRDLHLYLGLFISPFVLVFAVSVLFLVHNWFPGVAPHAQPERTCANLPLPANIESLSGRPRIEAIRPALDQAGVRGEVGFVRYLPASHHLVVPVVVPGRETTVDIDLINRTAAVADRETGMWDGFVLLHKSPGPHLVELRMNWVYMRVWRWLADATVYLLFFLSVSGIYLWTVLRAERRIGIVLMAAGAFSFFGAVYALAR